MAAPLRATGHPAVSVLLPTTPAGVMSEPDRGVLRGLLDRLRAVMGDRAALPCAQGYLLGRPSLEPPWRSTTSTRWPLRRIMMGPEPEATAVPSRCWCQFDGRHKAEPGIATSDRHDTLDTAGR
ncbi:hypothetical protein [Pengzhenrongella phosphoraccumulans]|uniref:hypothetical protein n=1 Tax=Pengzhenrongella phosphoraccumulans TaxID=3114394 RepID=UPI00388DDC1A